MSDPDLFDRRLTSDCLRKAPHVAPYAAPYALRTVARTALRTARYAEVLQAASGAGSRRRRRADFYPLSHISLHRSDPGRCPTVSPVVAGWRSIRPVHLPQKAIIHAAGADSRGPLEDRLSLPGRPATADLACAQSSFVVFADGAHPDVARLRFDRPCRVSGPPAASGVVDVRREVAP